ncbi:hypothetical protein [Bernardetia sp. MNP-M8]|uniref:hypothetical protein n=1 Tax=Bernardetia sp. MNP-M8 TaxID=3127470 RepID=UPI0030CE3F6C
MSNSTSSQNPSAIFKEIEELKRSFSFSNQEEEIAFYKKNSYLFAFTSANLSRLMPQIPYSHHKSIFEKLLFNLQLLNIEEQNPALFAPNFEVIDKTDILQQAKNGKPFLFCCFHLGSYSSLLTLLTYNDLDFGFLLNQTLRNRKADDSLKVHQKFSQQIEIQQKRILKSKIQFINVEENKGIWSAIRMLKQGNSLIVYPDGNTGINTKESKKENQNTVQVNFLNERLLVKQGVAFLSYACQVPIVPVISSRVDESIEYSLKRKFELLPAIYPPNSVKGNAEKENKSKEEFAAHTMQKLYSILEKEISKKKNQQDINAQANQWEGWIFVNKSFENLKKPIYLEKESQKQNSEKITKEKLNSEYIFNEAQFALIESKKDGEQNVKYTLFDKYTYRFFPVSDLLYETITYFSVPKKLYLSNSQNKRTNPVSKDISNSPVAMNSDSELQLSKTSIPISALEKLINKKILVQFN